MTIDIWLPYNRTLCSLVRTKEEVFGVKVYGSRQPMSKRTGDIGMARSAKRDKQGQCTSLGGRVTESRSGTWNLAVLGTRRCMRFVR
jgi:hypothetical protein